MTIEEKEKALEHIEGWYAAESARIKAKVATTTRLLNAIPKSAQAYMSGSDIFTQMKDEPTLIALAAELGAEYRIVPDPSAGKCFITIQLGQSCLFSGNLPLRGHWHKTTKSYETYEKCEGETQLDLPLKEKGESHV